MDDEIRAEIISVDDNSSLVHFEISAMGKGVALSTSNSSKNKSFAEVHPGDLNLLSNTKVFRGILKKTFSPQNGEIFSLQKVWPDEFSERIKVNNVNRLLRRDTLSMREDSIKSIGDQLPPFALYDQDGETITTDYFDGSVTILNFIFTRCSEPEMCPAATMKMKKLQQLVKKNKIPFVKFLSITLDPVYDTPGILKSYAMGYNLSEENYRLGTAKKSVIDDLTRQFGILRKKEPELPLDHTMRTIVINSRRQIVYQVPGKGWGHT